MHSYIPTATALQIQPYSDTSSRDIAQEVPNKSTDSISIAITNQTKNNKSNIQLVLSRYSPTATSLLL